MFNASKFKTLFTTLLIVSMAIIILPGCATSTSVKSQKEWPVIDVPPIIQQSPEAVQQQREERLRKVEEARMAREEARKKRLAEMPTVSGEYFANSLRDVLQDFSQQAGVPIVYDYLVEGDVTMNLNEVPLEKAIEMVIFAGGFEYILKDGVYYIGSIEQLSPSLISLNRMKTIRTNYPAPVLTSLLSQEYESFVGFEESQPHMLTINAPERILRKIEEELMYIDSLRNQIVVDVLVVDISHDKSFNTGFDYSDIEVSASGLGEFTKGLSAGYTSSIMANLLATIQFLYQQGAVDLKANPKLVVMDGETGNINVTLEQRFAILSGNVSFPQVFIEVVETGVTMEVTPWILPDGYVQLKLRPEVSDVVGQTRQSSEAGGSQTLPVVSRRSVESTLRVRLGETVIIGGLRNTFLRNVTSKVPGLGDIPIVNFAFANSSIDAETKEMLVLLTPRLVAGGMSADEFSEKATESFNK